MILLKCNRIEGKFVYVYEQGKVEYVFTHGGSPSHSRWKIEKLWVNESMDDKERHREEKHGWLLNLRQAPLPRQGQRWKEFEVKKREAQ